MALLDLQSMIIECEDRSGYKDASFTTHWKAYLNEGLREFARRHPWPGLEDEYTTVIPANSRYLIFPHFVEEVLDITDVSNSTHIERAGEFGRQSPATFAQLTTGRPIQYDLIGEVPALAEPTGYVWLKSSNASDTSPVYISGLVAQSGASGTAAAHSVVAETTALNGVSPVTLSTLFTRFLAISRTSDLTGDFLAFDAGNSGAHMCIIPRGESSSRYKRAQFLYVPSANTTVRIRFRHKVPQLVDDGQVPPPGVEADFLINYALGVYWRFQEQYQKAALHDAKAGAILQAEATRDENFGEPFSQIQPYNPYQNDPDDDGYRQGW